MKTTLIAGLGNPGKKYEATRHNAGFVLLDRFHETLDFPAWEMKKKFEALASAKVIGKKKIILLKPQTFMNLSGKSVVRAMKYYGVRLADLVVVHDEIDLPLGKWKISSNSRAAGHNGVQDVIDSLGTKNFIRLRLGIEDRKKTGKTKDKYIPTEEYVLGKFSVVQKKLFAESIASATREIEERVPI